MITRRLSRKVAAKLIHRLGEEGAAKFVNKLNKKMGIKKRVRLK